MKIKSCFVCLVAMFICGISAAHAAPSFLKVGSWYSITASPGVPLLPQASSNPTDVSSLKVKVVELGSGEWCLVEYDFVPSVSNGQPVTIYKNREWLNFDHVVNATPSNAPDYKTVFPAGYKITLYK